MRGTQYYINKIFGFELETHLISTQKLYQKSNKHLIRIKFEYQDCRLFNAVGRVSESGSNTFSPSPSQSGEADHTYQDRVLQQSDGQRLHQLGRKL